MAQTIVGLPIRTSLASGNTKILGVTLSATWTAAGTGIYTHAITDAAVVAEVIARQTVIDCAVDNATFAAMKAAGAKRLYITVNAAGAVSAVIEGPQPVAEIPVTLVVTKNCKLAGVPNNEAIGNGVYFFDTSKLLNAPIKATGSGTMNLTVANNTDYSYTGVTSLVLAAANVECHGFITFGAAPTVNVSGFAGSAGDDITRAKANETWEFSVYAHNSGAYIVWKNWSA